MTPTVDLGREHSVRHELTEVVAGLWFQNMIDLSMSTPIQDESVYQFPLDLVSQLLQEVGAQVRSVASLHTDNNTWTCLSDEPVGFVRHN